MDRCAVLVDAGYLYAEGGKLCCGTPRRTRSVLQPALAVDLLQNLAKETTQVPVLRTYWYDGARDGIRTKEQHEDDDQSRQAARSAFWGVIGGTIRDRRSPD